MPELAVIVLNYKRALDTLECIRSLRQSTYTDFEVFVVDNASGDGSVELLQQHCADVRIIANESNVGFAQGNNVGIREAMSRPGEFILLLNNDTVVDRDALRVLVMTMKGRTDTGILGPKIYFHDRPTLLWFAGGKLNAASGAASHRGMLETDNGQYDQAGSCDFVTGCCLLIRRSVVERIGMLDADYFAYFEDSDFCLRARRAGFEVCFEPAARIWHKVSTTVRWDSPVYLYFTLRNRLILLRKNSTFLMSLPYLPLLVYYYSRQFIRLLVKWRDLAGARAAWFGLIDGIRGYTGTLGRGRLDQIAPRTPATSSPTRGHARALMTFLLGILEKFIPSYPIPHTPQAVRTVLVVDLNFLGDMLLSSPVYRALREHLPEARIEALVLPVAQPAVAINPFIDALHLMPSITLRDQIGVAIRMRIRSFDLVLQLNTSLRVNFLLWIMGRRYRLGYNYAHRGCLLNIRIPIGTRTARRGRRTDECVNLLEQGLGWRVTNRDMIFPVDPHDTEKIRLILKSRGVRDGDLLLGMHTNCRQGWAQRRWDMTHFAELGTRLTKDRSVRLVLTGAPEDAEYVSTLARILQPADRVINLAGALTLHELAALLTQLSAFVTLNTGPMHIAVAQRTPTLAIIGGTPPPVVFPTDDPIFEHVMDPALKQWDPTVLTPAYEPLINTITVDEVMEKATHLIQTQGGKRRYRHSGIPGEATA